MAAVRGAADELLHGLIQWAVAFEHHRRGNAHGARVLLDRAWSRLAGAPDGYMGLDPPGGRPSRSSPMPSPAGRPGPRPAAEAPPIAPAGVG